VYQRDRSDEQLKTVAAAIRRNRAFCTAVRPYISRGAELATKGNRWFEDF
jgi:hypothetical protein